MIASRHSWGTIWTLAGSRYLTVFVLVMAITYVLVLAAFGMLVQTRWLDIIAGLYPYRLLYTLFFVNLVACGIAWLPMVVRRCKREELPEPGAKAARATHVIEVPSPAFRIKDFKQRLRWHGYSILDAASGSGFSSSAASGPVPVCCARRGRFSLAGNLLFHAGFLLLLVGAITNVFYRFEGTAIIAEGDSFTGTKKEYRRIADSFKGAIPRVDFDVEKISAEFWKGKVFFTGLEARLVHRGGRATARLSDAVRVEDADVTIRGFGYVPLAELKDERGEIVTRANLRLNIFPPGSEDYFFVPGYPHKIYVSFYPDHEEANGKILSRSVNPVNPAYFLRIMRGRIPVYSGLVKPGAWVDYDGLSISFPSFVRSGDFRVVSNPGHPFIWVAFVMMCLGLAWRLLFYRKDVALWRDGSGRLWLCGRFDYFPKLNAAWLTGLAEELRSRPG